jgi:hypothetical protein
MRNELIHRATARTSSGRIAHRALLSLTLLALVLLCGTALAAGTSGYGLTVLVGETPRTEYRQGGTVYVEAVRGRSYALRLTNPTPYRVAVALSVDGLNTIDARHTNAREAAKWVLEPYESTVISGWQVSDKAARQFFFTGERHSYGAALGQTDNLGVIEAVFFRERHPEVSTYGRRWDKDEAEQGGAGSGRTQDEASKAQPRSGAAAPPAAEPKPALSDDYAATGMGHSTSHEVESVNMELESHPIASVRVRYEFRPQLVKLGIFPSVPTPLERRERASGFGGYCPVPGAR